MIFLDVADYCQDCKMFDPAVEWETEPTIAKVVCKNHKLCRNLYRHILKAERKRKEVVNGS